MRKQYAFNFGIMPDKIFNDPHVRKVKNSIYRYPLSTMNRSVICKLESRVAFLKSDINNIIAVTLDGKLLLRTSNNKKSETDLSCYLSGSNSLNQNSFVYIPKQGLFIASSMWDSSFHIFQLQGSNFNLINSNHQFSLIVSIVDADETHIVTASKDSSLILWNLSGSISKLYRISPHNDTFIDFDVSNILNLIVSCDKSGSIVLSKLDDGSYVSSFVIEHPIKKLKISNYGSCIIIAYEIEIGTIQIATYNIDLNVVSSFRINSDNIDWCEIGFGYSTSCLAISDSNNKVYILSLPCLDLLTTLTSEE